MDEKKKRLTNKELADIVEKCVNTTYFGHLYTSQQAPLILKLVAEIKTLNTALVNLEHLLRNDEEREAWLHSISGVEK